MTTTSEPSLITILKTSQVSAKPAYITFSLNGVENGPKDQNCRVESTRPLTKNPSNDFVIDRNSPDIYISTSFAVTTLVFRMVNRDIHYLKQKVHEFSKQGQYEVAVARWEGRNAVTLSPDNQNENSRPAGTQTITFPISEENQEGSIIDALAYSAGRAVLDILRPDLANSQNLETRNFSKAFGQITILFHYLEEPHMRADLMSGIKGNLGGKAQFPVIGKQFDNDGEENNGSDSAAIELAQPFTKAIYSMLSQEFQLACSGFLAENSIDEVLQIVGKNIRRLVLKAVIQTRNMNASASLIGRHMTRIAKDDKKLLISADVGSILKANGIDIQNDDHLLFANEIAA